MTPIRKVAAVALTSLTLAAAFAPSAEARYGRNAALAVGILGGIAAGAIIASQPRPAYAAPVYGGGPVYDDRPVYARPAYARPVLVQDQPQCVRRRIGHDDWGRPIFRRVCY